MVWKKKHPKHSKNQTIMKTQINKSDIFKIYSGQTFNFLVFLAEVYYHTDWY